MSDQNFVNFSQRVAPGGTATKEIAPQGSSSAPQSPEKNAFFHKFLDAWKLRILNSRQQLRK